MHMRQNTAEDERLLQLHQRHLGLYARVAAKLKVNPSHVSRVARGQRENAKIMAEVLTQLHRLR
jgi:hypothetical protein